MVRGVAPGVVATFARRSRQAVGQSPYAWFLRRRIDRAKHLLAAPHADDVRVAPAVGTPSGRWRDGIRSPRRFLNVGPGVA